MFVPETKIGQKGFGEWENYIPLYDTSYGKTQRKCRWGNRWESFNLQFANRELYAFFRLYLSCIQTPFFCSSTDDEISSYYWQLLFLSLLTKRTFDFIPKADIYQMRIRSLYFFSLLKKVKQPCLPTGRKSLAPGNSPTHLTFNF